MNDEHPALRVFQVVAIVALLLYHLSDEEGDLLLDDFSNTLETTKENA